MSLIISSMKYKLSGTSISFHPDNFTVIPSELNREGLYEYPERESNLLGPQYGCSPGRCKFIINPMFFSLNVFINSNFLIRTLLGR